MIQVITPAGDRHEAWALSQEYMQAQTYEGPVRWIVVDDGKTPLKPAFKRPGYALEMHRLEPMAGNSQARNMLHALNQVEGDGPVFCWEDDDIYLPEYVETMLEALETADLAGERYARYYNVATGRYKEIRGKIHSSMASTVCKGGALQLLRALCNSGLNRMLDVNLWKQFNGDKRLMDSRNVVGIKGLPGRPGIGVGHRKRFGVTDNGDTLRVWAGEYADNYGIFKGAV